MTTATAGEAAFPLSDRPSRLLTAAQGVRLCWRASRWLFAWSALLQVIGAAALGIQVLAIRHLLTQLLAGGSGVLSRTIPGLLLFVGSYALTAIAGAARSSVQPLLGQRVGRYAIGEVLAVAVGLDLAAYEEPVLHNRLQHALVYAVTRPMQLAAAILGLLGTFGGVVGVTLSLIGISPWLVLLVAAGAVPGYLTASRMNLLVYAFTKQQAESDRRRNFLQALMISREPAAEVRGYQMENALLDQWQAISEDRDVQLRSITSRRLKIATLAAIASAAVTGGAVLILIASVDSHQISLASAGAGALALVLLAQQLQGVAQSVAGLSDSSRFTADLLNFVQQAPPTTFAGTEQQPDEFSALTTHSVGFHYPAGPPCLRGVDVEVHRGEVIALVGRNGSGKTTLAKILCGLYQPSQGQVRFNGVPVDDLDITAFRSRLTPVFQHPTHMQVPVDTYVGLGRPSEQVDPDRVENAVRGASMAPAIERLPHGYSTQLGPEFMDGTELSGGQWQRLALARALYRGGDVVILDEPAAALDPLAEAELFGQAKRLFPDQAVVLISHRFGSVRTADRIYVLEDGAIVEVGTHTGLLAHDGLYSQMYRAQKDSLLGDGDLQGLARPTRRTPGTAKTPNRTLRDRATTGD